MQITLRHVCTMGNPGWYPHASVGNVICLSFESCQSDDLMLLQLSGTINSVFVLDLFMQGLTEDLGTACIVCSVTGVLNTLNYSEWSSRMKITRTRVQDAKALIIAWRRH